jgi:hypothetical protein
MSFILPTNVLGIQNEMKTYKQLCLQYDYTPAQKEYEDIVRFILLFSGDGISESIINENSSSLDYLYESFVEDLDEARAETNGEAEFDTAVGTAVAGVKAAKNAVVGAGVAAGAGVALAAVGIGAWISYMFKKGKVKKAANKEYDAADTQLNDYAKIYQLKSKKAELEGREAPKGDFPGYPG